MSFNPLSPLRAQKRSNLKKPESQRTGHGLRVKFNPLALLLDASLEGEFDLVQRIIYEVRRAPVPSWAVPFHPALLCAVSLSTAQLHVTLHSALPFCVLLHPCSALQ